MAVTAVVRFSDEGLAELRGEITRLTGEVGALEATSQQRGLDPVARERALARIRDIEARLERVVAQARELDLQMTLIESWRR